MSIFYDVSIHTAFKADPLNPRNSEASVIELKDRGLLMAWQCFSASDRGSGDAAPGVIALANSFDNGASWHHKRVVAEMKDNCVNCYTPALFRAEDSGIVLLFRRYTQLEYGKVVLNNCYRITSYDEGETWSEEERIWENSVVGIMNHGTLRIADGTLLLPVSVNHGVNGSPEDHECVAVLRTRDDFKTYTMSNVITAPKRGLMEPAIAQCPDGSLNMVMRTQLGSVYLSRSTDGGKTWSEAVPTPLKAPESCPYIISIPHSDAQLVIWNHSYDPNFRSHYGKRSPLTMAITRDSLQTFSEYFDLESDPGYAFTNPSVTVTSSGLFVLNYWACKYSDDWVMDGLIDLKVATFRVDPEG